MKDINEIIKKDLCLGCGLCAAISKETMMKISSNGFYRPTPTPKSLESIDNIVKICPGINIEQEGRSNTDVWGEVESVMIAFASDPSIRHYSSSGGVTSALALYLLENGKVDGILHIGVTEGDWLHNKLYVSTTRKEVLSRNASRYAPADMFSDLFNILDNDNSKKYCFIGKPCDIAAICNIKKAKPQYKDRIPYLLSIFCAGMPSYNATHTCISTLRVDSKPINLRYRGDGWPGCFTVDFADGTQAKMSYNESWGKILGRQLGFRCKICPDGIGLLADIASGDAWNTKNGYPDFEDSLGKNFCFVRNQRGKSLFEAAINAGYIQVEHIDVSKIKEMQKYQYERRRIVGWRIAVVQLLTSRILNFSNLGIYHMALKSDFIAGIKEAIGTIKRFNSIKIQNE